MQKPRNGEVAIVFPSLGWSWGSGGGGEGNESDIQEKQRRGMGRGIYGSDFIVEKLSICI